MMVRVPRQVHGRSVLALCAATLTLAFPPVLVAQDAGGVSEAALPPRRPPNG